MSATSGVAARGARTGMALTDITDRILGGGTAGTGTDDDVPSPLRFRAGSARED
jgi:hypothetical protein